MFLTRTFIATFLAHSSYAMQNNIRDLAKAGDWDLIFEQFDDENTNIDVNAKDPENGKTLLHYVADSYKCSEKEVEKLLELNADIDATDANNQTPLHIATRWATPEVLQALLERNANLVAMDNDGNSPLSLLCTMWLRDDVYLEDIARTLISAKLFRNSTLAENDIVDLLATDQFQKIEKIKNENQLNFSRMLRLGLLKHSNNKTKDLYRL